MNRNNSQIRQKIEGLLAIPANEQCIGHFQVAVQGLLTELLDLIEKLQREKWEFHA